MRLPSHLSSLCSGGTTQPRKAPPLPASPPAMGRPSTIGPQATPRITMVLSFEGNSEDFPASTVEENLQVLKELTGDTALTITNTEIGSFHIFLVVRAEDAP